MKLPTFSITLQEAGFFLLWFISTLWADLRGCLVLFLLFGAILGLFGAVFGLFNGLFGASFKVFLRGYLGAILEAV